MPLRRRFSVRSQLCCDTKQVFLSFKSLDEPKKAGPGTVADPRMGGLRPARSNSHRIVTASNSNRISRTLGTNLKNEIKQWNAFVVFRCRRNAARYEFQSERINKANTLGFDLEQRSHCCQTCFPLTCQGDDRASSMKALGLATVCPESLATLKQLNGSTGAK